MSAAPTTRWVRDEPAFSALQADWNRLCDAMPQATVFHRHEWFAAAWQWQRHSHALAILVVESGGVPIGIAPLASTHTPTGGGLRAARLLEFITVPDSQCCDLLAATADLPAVSAALAGALRQAASHWDELRLRLLPDACPGVSALHAALQAAGLRPVREASGANPCIDLSGSWQDYYATRSRRLKKGNNLIANHLRKAGTVTVQHIAGALEPADADRLLDTFADVSAKSWKQRTGNTLDQSGPRAFFAALTRAAAAQGWLSVWLLRLDDAVIATEYQLRFGGRVHALRSDFDPAHDSLSPGTYLNWKLLEASFGGEHTQYLFGPGDNPYKQRWAQHALTLSTLRAWSPSLRGRLRQLWFARLRPLAKRLLRRTDQAATTPAAPNPTTQQTDDA
jgi:CelD/BcsL family acetyltransferase involved in cellulose biosynthesis